jgi:predicted dehydrogenase
MLPEFAGGALLDLAVYPISLAHMVLGPPERITATAALTPEGVDSQTTAIFDYASGAQAILTANMIAITPCRAVINATAGRIEIDTTFYRPTTMRVILNDGSVTEYPNDYPGGGWREQAVEFANVVRAGKIESSQMRLDDTLQIMESMDEIRRLIKLKFPFE